MLFLSPGVVRGILELGPCYGRHPEGKLAERGMAMARTLGIRGPDGRRPRGRTPPGAGAILHAGGRWTSPSRRPPRASPRRPPEATPRALPARRIAPAPGGLSPRGLRPSGPRMPVSDPSPCRAPLICPRGVDHSRISVQEFPEPPPARRPSAENYPVYSINYGYFGPPRPPSLAKSAPRLQERASGEMAEWLKAHAWKACVRETVPWVRF